MVRKIKLNKHPRLHHFEQILVTFILVCFSWIFFRAEDLNQAFKIISKMLIGFRQFIVGLLTADGKMWSSLFEGPELGLSRGGLFVATLSVAFLIWVQYIQRNTDIRDMLRCRPTWQRWSLYYLVIIIIAFFGVFDEVPFIYFQF